MKIYVAASALPAKRRWKGQAVVVFALVFFSLLVPLAFLLNGFHSGYLMDEKSSSETSFPNYDRADSGHGQNQSEDDQPRIVDDLLKRFGPTIPEDAQNTTKESKKNFKEKPQSESLKNDGVQFTSQSGTNFHPKGVPSPGLAAPKSLLVPNTIGKVGGRTVSASSVKRRNVETVKSCQIEFGSYCLWSVEHREEMKDSMVKKLKDQLFVARAYYPSIAKLEAQEKLSHQMKQNIQEHERMLSEAVVDAELPRNVMKKIQRMEETIAKAKSFHVDCNNVERKLRQILDLAEDETHFHMRQSAFLYHLGTQTMPKSLHCLSMRLTVEYFTSPLVETDVSHLEKLDNRALHHFVILSRNILASSVAINSTVMNAKDSGNLVFHLLTDGQNYFAMKFWFLRYSYKEAMIHVLNIEDVDLSMSYKWGLRHLSLSEEFRISMHKIGKSPSMQMRTEYVSNFGYTHFLLPGIFKNLKKVVVLDDDVVVQRDLSTLWDLDLEGKVNGAVEFCGVRLGQLKSYFGHNSYNNDTCAWMSGLNVVDLERWRELNITNTYQQLLQELKIRSGTSWRAAALPASLLSFRDLIYALDDSWVLSGLGHDYGAATDMLKNAAVLHYNGNMKPWLDLGIPKYKRYWKNFLMRDNRYMDECNVNS